MATIKHIKKIAASTMAVFTLVIALLVNSVEVQAVTFSATPNSTWSKVTISYSNCYGTTIFNLKGYERHSETGQYYYYNKSNSNYSSGQVSATFSANTGYVFIKKYNGEYLTASVRINGTVVGTLVVTG